MSTRIIEVSEEESLYLQFCMALGTVVVTGLPVADMFVGRVAAGITSGCHKSLLEKLAPERAAQVMEMTAKGDSIEDTMEKIKDRAEEIRQEWKKNAH